MDSKYKIVIFDFDDTLMESRQVIWDLHKHVAKKFYDINLKDEDILKHWGKPQDVVIRELYQYKDTDENMIKAILSERKNFSRIPYKESVNTIRKIQNNNIKVGILSAGTKRYLVEELINLGFQVEEFSIIQGSDETEFHKPDPKVFLPIIQKLEKEGINKNEIVYVGDSVDDYLAATGAGLDFIGVTTGLYSEKDFKERGVKTIINEIEEVVEKVI